MSFLSEMLDNLKKFEGEENRAYTDTKGYVTVGYGSKIDDVDTFKSLPFHNGNRFATEEEKESEFNSLSGRKSKYSSFSLDNNTIRDLAEEHIKDDMKVVRQKFKNNDDDFDDLPDNAKLVIMDMQYNMGGNFTKDKWPMFFDAVKREDWKTAARESQSSDIQASRNLWRKNTLLEIDDE